MFIGMCVASEQYPFRKQDYSWFISKTFPTILYMMYFLGGSIYSFVYKPKTLAIYMKSIGYQCSKKTNLTKVLDKKCQHILDQVQSVMKEQHDYMHNNIIKL